MASQGPNSPSSAGNVDRSSGTTWGGTSNTGSSDNSYATQAGHTTNTDYLRLSSFGFTIPSGATIDGIVVEVESSRAGAGPGSSRFDEIRVTKVAGTPVGSDGESSTTPVDPTETYYSWGSSSDLWGTTWNDSEINSTGFGVMVAGSHIVTGGSATWRIDHVRVTVYYTDAAGQPMWTRRGGLWTPQRLAGRLVEHPYG